MAHVDPDNDDIRRFVVYWYAYDPERHERRHQVMAAFDNKREYGALLDRAAADLEHRRTTCKDFDQLETIHGAILEPGTRRRAQEQRLVRRAFEHGVSHDPRIQHLERSAGGAVLRALRRLFPG